MSIQSFLNQTGTLKTRTGYNQYGKEKQAAGSSVKCRFQNKSRTYLLPDGSVESYDGLAFFDPAISVTEGDHFVFSGIDYRVLSVDSKVVGNGLTHHLEVRLQKWQS